MAEVPETQEQLSGRPPWMAEVPGAKPSVNEASFTGQTQGQFFRQRFLFAALVCALWIAPAQQTHAADPELHVIALKHRLADEVVPLVRPLLAPGESVTGMDSRLIVRAAAHSFAQIERVLAEIDTPRRNLRISVRHTGESEHLQESQGVSGDVRRGNTRIVVTNANRGTSGVTVQGSVPSGAVQIHSERRTTTTRDNSTQNLTVLDGGRAFLRVGESIPQVQPFLVLVGNRLSVVTGIQYYDVTTGFEVEPRILGERVQLAVTPRLAFRSSQGAQTVNFQELRTVLMVKPGEWVDLGGAVESANEVNRQILGIRRHTDSIDSRFMVRVDLQ